MFNLFSKDIGIDLGTASVLVYIKGKGVVLREPSVVAMDKNTGKLLKVGTDAQAMLGRTPGNIVAMRPLREGVISDYDMTERMLKEFIKKVTTFSLFKPRLLICVPSGITEVEERAVVDAGIQAGARRAYLIEEPVAAAIGAGIDITKPDGHMVVDIGGGTADIAVISLHRRHRRHLPGRRGGVRLHQDRRRQVRRGGGQVYPQEAQRAHRRPHRRGAENVHRLRFPPA